jgi:hypothetical protein
MSDDMRDSAEQAGAVVKLGSNARLYPSIYEDLPTGLALAAKLGWPLMVHGAKIVVPPEYADLIDWPAGNNADADAVYDDDGDSRVRGNLRLAIWIANKMRCAELVLEETGEAMGLKAPPPKPAAPIFDHVTWTGEEARQAISREPEVFEIDARTTRIGAYDIQEQPVRAGVLDERGVCVVDHRRNLIVAWHRSKDAALAWAMVAAQGAHHAGFNTHYPVGEPTLTWQRPRVVRHREE